MIIVRIVLRKIDHQFKDSYEERMARRSDTLSTVPEPASRVRLDWIINFMTLVWKVRKGSLGASYFVAHSGSF